MKLAPIPTEIPNTSTHHLAYRYAPVIRFDRREPFFPLVAGYSVFHDDAESASFPRVIELTPPDAPHAVFAIEYAIWWDWDIQHLYELEHVWVYVGEHGEVVRTEASWHGGYHNMAMDGVPTLLEGQALVYSEPGKHAFAPTPDWFHKRWQNYKRTPTNQLAGMSGVLVTRLFSKEMRPLRNPLHNTLVRTWLQDHAFDPSWDFSQEFRFSVEQLAPWPAVREWIPKRMAGWTQKLVAQTEPGDYRFLRIGHRGASAHAPDNTLAGIHKAAQLGADAVEIDIQVTADGQAVVVHDGFVSASDGQNLPINGSTFDELRQVDLGEGQTIPTLIEVIELVKSTGLGLYMELKDSRSVSAIIAAYQEHGLENRAIIASFRPDWIAEIRAHFPHAHTAILFSSTHVDPVALAQSIGANYVHPCWERFEDPQRYLTAEWVSRVRAAGLGIICWHEERPEVLAALGQIGVDGICSDTPERLVKERGNGG